MSAELSLIEYKNQVSHYPMLDPQIEINLLKDFKLNNSKTAFNAILESYLRLVVSIVEKIFKNKYPNINKLDMISSGNIGLIIALNKFDISKDVKFATYAQWWIIAKIQEFIASNISIIKQNQKEVHKTLFTSNKSQQNIQSDISIDSNPTQINILSNNAISQEEFLIYQEENNKHIQILNQIWKTLNDREKYIIYHRFISEEKKPLKVIAQEFNISNERVRQIEVRLKNYIKNVIAGKILLKQKKKLLKK